MSNKLIILTSIVMAFLVSCSGKDDPIVPQPEAELPDVEVAFNTALTTSTKEDITGKTYDRGDAPVFVGGVNITATNNTDTSYPQQQGTYAFVDAGNTGDALTMIVKPGNNTFEATSFAADGYTEYTETLADLDRPTTITNLQGRSEHYAGELKTRKATYAEYAGSATQDITEGADNEVDLAMDPLNGRVNIVFEADPDLIYKMVATLYDDTQQQLDSQEATLDDNLNYAAAIMYNTMNMTSGTKIEVKISKKSPSDTEFFDIDTTVNLDVEVGTNVTHLIHYNGSDTETATFDLSFTAIVDSSGGTEITD